MTLAIGGVSVLGELPFEVLDRTLVLLHRGERPPQLPPPPRQRGTLRRETAACALALALLSCVGRWCCRSGTDDAAPCRGHHAPSLICRRMVPSCSCCSVTVWPRRR